MVMRRALGKTVRIGQRQIRRLANIKAAMFYEDYIFGAWSVSPNWGDALNTFLIEEISGKKLLHYVDVFSTSGAPIFSVVGSILGAYNVKDLIVWGSGFISADRSLRERPRLITAVRGPKSREKLLDLGLECPEIYGDPALLIPNFIKPNPPQTKYEIGIIPHYVDKDHPYLEQFTHRDDILIIDICSGIKEVVDAISSCKLIASSSLHGLICADAYGIPSVWLEFSDKVVGSGFKFRDYFESVGRRNQTPLIITPETSKNEILDRYTDYNLNIDLDALWDACPFRPDVLE